jgi:hypothetical protein
VCLRRIRVVNKLARPFLATGILGGFTTFSTAAVDSQQLATSGHLFLGAVNISRHRRRRPGRRPPHHPTYPSGGRPSRDRAQTAIALMVAIGAAVGARCAI